MHECRQDPCTARANRMAECDGAAVNVDLCRIYPKFAYDGQ